MAPLLLGHRGARASRNIPENTSASFELCLQHGCDGFEFDVRRSADGQAVICHDPVARGMPVEAASAKDLGLPLLGEVLQAFGSRAFLDIELKVAGLAREMVMALLQDPPLRGYVVSSFLLDALSSLHSLDASIALGFLCERRQDLYRWAELPVDWVIPQFQLVDQSLVEEVHRAGRKVMAWTVNQQDQIRRLADWGVDAIISDETELMVRSMS